ncbi:uncharacterized protein KZ484_003799 isoform 2-T2 [Pholidichthys leucotaenia]
MWTEEKNTTSAVTRTRNGSQMVEPALTVPLLHAVQQRNGAIAATVFIAFLLAFYAVLWKCMVSPPQRKGKGKVRVRMKHRPPV